MWKLFIFFLVHTLSPIPIRNYIILGQTAPIEMYVNLCESNLIEMYVNVSRAHEHLLPKTESR